MENKGKIATAIVGGLVLVGAGLAVGYSLQPEPTVITVEKQVIVPKEVVKTVQIPVEVPVEKIVTNTIQVPVDNCNLQLVLDHLYDNNGQVEYLLDDLEDDELDQIVDRIVFINDVKAKALNYVQKELADELDGEVVSDVELDEDDIEKIRLDDDQEDVLVEDVDFEDKDAEVVVTGKFRHDDVWYKFSSTVQFEDGDIDSFEIDSVELE